MRPSSTAASSSEGLSFDYDPMRCKVEPFNKGGRSMKIAKSLSAAALYVVAIAWPVAAYAGSAASYDCSLTKQTIFASTTLVPMSDLGVTVDLGSNQTYQVQLSADICVS